MNERFNGFDYGSSERTILLNKLRTHFNEALTLKQSRKSWLRTVGCTCLLHWNHSKRTRWRSEYQVHWVTSAVWVVEVCCTLHPGCSGWDHCRTLQSGYSGSLVVISRFLDFVRQVGSYNATSKTFTDIEICDAMSSTVASKTWAAEKCLNNFSSIVKAHTQ